MLPDRVSNSGPLTYESGALPIALRGPALRLIIVSSVYEGPSKTFITQTITVTPFQDMLW